VEIACCVKLTLNQTEIGDFSHPERTGRRGPLVGGILSNHLKLRRKSSRLKNIKGKTSSGMPIAIMKLIPQEEEDAAI